MKIGINATFLNEKPTGVGIFTIEISHFLSRLHSELIIFSPMSIKGVPENLIHKTPLMIKGSVKFRNNLYRTIYLNTVLPLHCKLSEINVIFSPLMEFPFINFTPLVVQIHDLHPIQFPSQFGRAATYFRFSLKLIERVVRRITVPSLFVKRELLKVMNIGKDKIDVIPLAYDCNLFIPQNIDKKREFLARYSIKGDYILFVGNLFPYKNVEILIDAFLRIKSKIGRSLVVVGRKELSSGLPEDEKILYMDYVPREDLPKFYSYADLLVHPSLNEGFGLTPLEAMACGTPVIASKEGALPEVIGDAGILIDPREIESFSKLILEVINNGRLRRELIEKGFKNVTKFSWEKTTECIFTSCERALRERM